MKLVRIVLLTLAMLLLLGVFASCTCVPSSVEWHLKNYNMDMEFIGGVVKTVTFSEISVAYPFAGINTKDTSIKFYDDGRVRFVTWDGEELNGTYTYKHEGSNYTKFTIEFDNGEKIDGDSASYFGSEYITFIFRNIVYNFTGKLDRVDYELKHVIQALRTGNGDTTYECTVSKVDEGYKLTFIGGAEVIINSESVVFAAHIDENDNFTVLDEIKEGECRAQYIEEVNYTILYYIDPAVE